MHRDIFHWYHTCTSMHRDIFHWYHTYTSMHRDIFHWYHTYTSMHRDIFHWYIIHSPQCTGIYFIDIIHTHQCTGIIFHPVWFPFQILVGFQRLDWHWFYGEIDMYLSCAIFCGLHIDRCPMQQFAIFVWEFLLLTQISYYNSSSVCLFVPYVLQGPLTDLRQTWWVYVGGPPICPWGVRFRKGQGVDGSTGHFCFPLYYICASLTPHAATAPSALLWSSSRV